jgi:predicted TIM-barrel fold metal-dependent hydrolase
MRSLVALYALVVPALAVAAPPPIIDMHLHASPADANGPPPLGICAPFPEFPLANPLEEWEATFLAWQKRPPCADPVWSPPTDDGLMNETLGILRRRNIVGMLSGTADRVRRWRQLAPDHVIPGLGFQLGPKAPSVDDVRRLRDEGNLAVLAEVSNQYVGISPDDAAFDPYLAMAEHADLPVGIHIGTGPPGAPYLGFAKYRARLHSALLLEEPLLRHPKLRVYVMHAGWPLIDDLLALLWAHPQVYVEVGAIDWALPRAEFHRYLQRIVEAGFDKRVMFGSDQMVWPGVIERAIEAVESAAFLSPSQKRDILYNNAARFLRFSDADVAKHHGR